MSPVERDYSCRCGARYPRLCDLITHTKLYKTCSILTEKFTRERENITGHVLLDLPNELISRILGFCSLVSLSKVSQVNKRLQGLTGNHGWGYLKRLDLQSCKIGIWPNTFGFLGNRVSDTDVPFSQIQVFHDNFAPRNIKMSPSICHFPYEASSMNRTIFCLSSG